jgi:Zn-finger nucleic acid-binding protein
MIVVEHEKIELDYCPNCSGIWFDAGELALMLETAGIEDNRLTIRGILSSSSEAKTTEKKRRCPICRRRLKKTTIGREPAVLIDLCTEGDGLWFDGGEVHQLITQHVERLSAGSDSQERVLTFLEDTFRAEAGPT